MDEAARLLALIGGSDATTFQTFDDDEERKQRALAKIKHGQLSNHRVDLELLNAKGAGVFFMVNQGDGKGRRAPNVLAVRALFADLDGAPLQPVLDCPLAPHAVVETSKGKFHAYWRVQGVPLEVFTPLQKSIASMFGGDPKVCDLPRVARLPGFDHRKGGGCFRSRIVRLQPGPAYTLTQALEAFPCSPSAPAAAMQRTTTTDRFGAGERNSQLFNAARGFHNHGYLEAEVNKRVQNINALRCDPPLCATEVDDIVRKACAEAAKGHLQIPLAVFDSQGYRDLPGNAQAIVNMAFRLVPEMGDAVVSLSPAMFSMASGTFASNVRKAEAAGFLVRVSTGRFGQLGNTTNRYQVRHARA